MIIGITGTFGAGKGEIVNILKQKGFAYYSCSDYLREELRKQGKEITIPNLAGLGNSIREQYGNGEIVKRLLGEIKEENTIIDSLRHPEEINELKKSDKFILIGVDANIGIRYERIRARNRNEDNLSFEEFVQEEEKQKTNFGYTMQLHNCLELADHKIENNGTLEELNKKLEEIYKEISEKEEYIRPSWDEYFMEVARTIAKRGTCSRGRSGCVIARNKQILVTGYVGSPKGLPHCDDIGHQFKKTIHEDGNTTNHCVRTVHAEQNAICQAAKLGVSIEGATLYCKMTPCRVCAMLIINSGIKRVVCEKRYHVGGESEEMFKQAGIELEFMNGSLEEYPNM
jgi:dCMP deaminase